MGSRGSLLSELRERTSVDCDTLDTSVAESLGPFTDCTSNQAIAFFELSNTKHAELIKQSCHLARELESTYPGIKLVALAVEICMVQLGLRILPHLAGRMHIQVNPFDAYSTKRTIADGERIIGMFNYLSEARISKDRICIKIPSTWEGLQACRLLEDQGINTLATTLFTIEQAALAAEVRCRYIAPYVNELAVHFEKGFIDPDPNQKLCVQAQRYFKRHGFTTQVLPASLTSIEECMALAGADHITIAPALLQALHESTDIHFPSLFHSQDFADDQVPAMPDFVNDEELFRISLTRNDNGLQEIKQVKAINVFANMQTKLEELMVQHMQ